MYEFASPQDQAEVRMAALTIDGSAGMPMRTIARTNGEEPAPFLEVPRSGSLDGTCVSDQQRGNNPLIRRETYQNADGKDSSDIEDKKTPDDPFEDVGIYPTRIFGLPSSHGNVVRATVCVRSANKGRKEAEEVTPSSTGDVVAEGARIVPVPEAEGVVLWISTDHGDDCGTLVNIREHMTDVLTGENNKSNYEEDLEYREIELLYTPLVRTCFGCNQSRGREFIPIQVYRSTYSLAKPSDAPNVL